MRCLPSSKSWKKSTSTVNDRLSPCCWGCNGSFRNALPSSPRSTCSSPADGAPRGNSSPIDAPRVCQQRRCKSVASEGRARRKVAKRRSCTSLCCAALGRPVRQSRSLHAVNEAAPGHPGLRGNRTSCTAHFEPLFNAAMPSVVAFARLAGFRQTIAAKVGISETIAERVISPVQVGALARLMILH